MDKSTVAGSVAASLAGRMVQAVRGGEFERMMERLRQTRGYFMRRYEEIRQAHGPSATGEALTEIEDLAAMRAGVASAILELGKAQT